jgi:DNA processing protein
LQYIAQLPVKGQLLFYNGFMEKILPWLALKNVPGIGNHLFKSLIDRFGTPHNVFAATQQDLQGIEGISRQLAAAILGFRSGDDIKREVDAAIEQNCRMVTLADHQYPPLLRAIHDPPPYLYVRGDLGDTEKSIAVVGSRQASVYGLSVAKHLSMDLAFYGLTVVSGMARGIDAAAHEGTLSAKGKTVAVLGSGLGVVYPPENEKLFRRIMESGAVISELPVMEPPNAYNFPARNRIIAGMTLGTVVVEAAAKSGSLITARLAAEQGREVFAVPGSINSAKSSGVHNLLKQGAKLVASVNDIIEEFPRVQFTVNAKDDQAGNANGVRKNHSIDMTPEETGIYQLLEPYPIHIDELSQKSGMGVGRLAGILLNLELRGIVHQTPGKYFCKRED